MLHGTLLCATLLNHTVKIHVYVQLKHILHIPPHKSLVNGGFELEDMVANRQIMFEAEWR